RHLHHGGPGRRRRDAELSVDLVPRRALCPRPLWPETGAGVRRLAGRDRAVGCRRTARRRQRPIARLRRAADLLTPLVWFTDRRWGGTQLFGRARVGKVAILSCPPQSGLPQC